MRALRERSNSSFITAAAYHRRRLSALGRLGFLGGRDGEGRDIAVQRGICDSAAPIGGLAPKGIALANNLLGREVRQPQGAKMLPPPGELGANNPLATQGRQSALDIKVNGLGEGMPLGFRVSKGQMVPNVRIVLLRPLLDIRQRRERSGADAWDARKGLAGQAAKAAADAQAALSVDANALLAGGHVSESQPVVPHDCGEPICKRVH